VTEGSTAADLIEAILTGKSPGPTDVNGIALQLPGGEPFVLVELGYGRAEDVAVVGGELVGEDMFGRMICNQGFTPTRDLYRAPHSSDGVKFVVRRKATDKRPSGVFGPGTDKEPNGWTVISPLPPWPREMDLAASTNGWQVGVYLTTATTGLCYLNGPALLSALHHEGDAGRLYATRAAVL
jgi:hypothetical protein